MIHAYKLNGYNIILDQNSGCVHSVDPVAYDMITMYQDHDKEEIRRFILEKYKDQPDVTNADIDLCFEDIEALIADGRCLPRIPLRRLPTSLNAARGY